MATDTQIQREAPDIEARKLGLIDTAKAVNNAGGGNSREGAKRMYQMMKNLEKGGRLSEQSRGRA